jgi:hypothetical protein
MRNVPPFADTIQVDNGTRCCRSLAKAALKV